jgi:hypothetical protein
MAGHVARWPQHLDRRGDPINSTVRTSRALGRKVTNDAVSYIGASLSSGAATPTGRAGRPRRGVDKPERGSVLKVVDFVASGVQDLLSQSNGRGPGRRPGGGVRQVTIQTSGASLYTTTPTCSNGVGPDRDA